MAENIQKQVVILAVLLVIGLLVLGSFAPQTMTKLSELGANFKISLFKEETSNVALGYVTLIIDPPVVQNEQAAK